jgi:hypothetical protein
VVFVLVVQSNEERLYVTLIKTLRRVLPACNY